MVFANCHTAKVSAKVKFKVLRTENMDLTFYPRYALIINACYDCVYREDCEAFKKE